MPRRRRHKFNAVKTVIDNLVFDSQIESDRYRQLKAREDRGDINDLVVKPIFVFRINDVEVTTLTLDFGYRENGIRVFEDVKCALTKTEAFRIKSKLLFACYRLSVKVVTEEDVYIGKRQSGKPRIVRGLSPEAGEDRVGLSQSEVPAELDMQDLGQ